MIIDLKKQIMIYRHKGGFADDDKIICHYQKDADYIIKRIAYSEPVRMPSGKPD